MDRGRSGDAGAQLRCYRRKAGLTQRQLADAAGVSIGVVRDLEQRRTAGLQPDSVRRLASALRLSRLQAAELAQAAQKVSAAGPGRLQSLSLGVLGPLRAWRGVAVPIGGPMQRAVLGLLALYPESGLHRTAIIDALWGDDPPATAVSMIQAYVRRLRYLWAEAAPTRSWSRQPAVTGSMLLPAILTRLPSPRSPAVHGTAVPRATLLRPAMHTPVRLSSGGASRCRTSTPCGITPPSPG